MGKSFEPEAELHIAPAEAAAAKTCKLVYAVSAAPDHDYQSAAHYECGRRVQEILSALSKNRLTAGDNPGEVVRLETIKPASEEELTALHDASHVTAVRRKAAEEGPCVIADFEEAPDNVTYVTKSSFSDALEAVGTALAVVDAVAASNSGSKTPKGFALIRPPGHHAKSDAPMGFCLFNNVALAARYAQQRHGLPKVMIVDFDVHHGNGTQDLFYDDASVLFIDMHEQDVWPGSGQIPETGSGQGQGYTINVPLPVGSGDEVATSAMQRIVVPAARRFNPDFMLVSAGFDAHWRDPLEKLNYQSATYHSLLGALQSLADELCVGKLVVLLEGGYSMQGLSEGVCEAFASLLGRPPIHAHDAEVPAEPLDAGRRTVDEIVGLHGLAA